MDFTRSDPGGDPSDGGHADEGGDAHVSDQSPDGEPPAGASGGDDEAGRQPGTPGEAPAGGPEPDQDAEAPETEPEVDTGEVPSATPGPAGGSVFKDSGSFFRERVAQTLAEQGYQLREDGTWGADVTTTSAGADDDTADAGDTDTPEPPRSDRAAGRDEPAEERADAAGTGPDAEAADRGVPDDAEPAPDEETLPVGRSVTPSFAAGASDADEDEDDEETIPAAPRGATPAGAAGAGAPDDDEETIPVAGSASPWTPAATAGGARGAEAGTTAGALDDDEQTIPAAPSGESPARAAAGAEAATREPEAGDGGDYDTVWDPDGTSAGTPGAGAGPDPAPGPGPRAGAHSGPASGPDDGPTAGSDAPTSATPSGPPPTFAPPETPPRRTGAHTGPAGPSAPASPPGTPGAGAAAGAGAAGAAGVAASAPHGAPSAPGSPSTPGTPSSPGAPAGPGAPSGPEGAAGAGAGAPPEPPGPTDPPEAAAASGGGPRKPVKSAMAKAKSAKAKKATKATKATKSGAAKRKRPLWWRITRGALIGVAACFVLGLIGFGIAYVLIPVPTAAKADATDQGSSFYYADGETKFAERGVDRDPVKYDEIPKEVQEAVIGAEDEDFWSEPGVSLTGTIRGAWSTFTGQQVQGGSTITQQMVRNYYEGVSKEQTITRKLKEIIIALKVDQSQSKQWVMEQYLNTIYFGRNAYGIQAAAHAYYHKDMQDLTPGEAAFLAAAIQQPTKFGQADSDTTPGMEKRWKYVVNQMVENGAITKAEAEKMEFPKPEEEKPSSDLSGYKGYMFQQAMSELKKLGYSEDNINRGGYKIVTTFEKPLMDAAKQAVEDAVNVDALPDGVHAGLTAVDPKTGEVVAFYGGKDFNKNQYDSAFRGSAQAGSSFKPYVLAAALKKGYSLNSVVDGSDNQVFAGSVIRNSHKGGGPMTLVEATRESSNTAYMNLAQQTGLKNVVNMAHAAGIPEHQITKEQAVAPTLALGISNISAVDQASGYSTFANGGMHVEPHVVREIIDRDGENQRPEVKSSRAMEEGVAADVTYALQQVVKSGTGTSAALPDGRPVAGKTGTTDNSVAGWFAGYTPQLSTAAGVYNGNNQPFFLPGYGEVYGGNAPATIWREFMEEAMEGKEVKQFPEPSFGGTERNWAPDVPETTEAPEPEPTRPPEEDSPPPEDPGDDLPPTTGPPPPGDSPTNQPPPPPDDGETGGPPWPPDDGGGPGDGDQQPPPG